MQCCSHKGEPNGAEIKRLNHQLKGINVLLLLWTNDICGLYVFLTAKMDVHFHCSLNIQQLATVNC